MKKELDGWNCRECVAVSWGHRLLLKIVRLKDDSTP